MRVLAVLFAMAPLAFGSKRLMDAHDYRMLAMAVAAFAGTMIVTAIGRSRGGSGVSAGVVFFVATVIAACVAYLLGARAAAGVWPVAIVFGLCYTISDILMKRLRGEVTSS